ncbi:MAG TPA: hypothetical protein DEB39_12710 [Planctomycetaceae bacterium]|nr:hypothetical protein [Planctomycetaceae bacterium]
MFETLKKWFGLVAHKERETVPFLATAYRRLADIPDGTALHDKKIVLCRGNALSLVKEGELPDRLENDEVCWIVPTGDVPLPLDFPSGENRIRATVRLRFEADRAFAFYAAMLLASGNEGISSEMLARLVVGQWYELMDLLHLRADRFVSDREGVLSRFRTHLSLLLQQFGFRCVGIDPVVLESVVPESTVPEEAAGNDFPKIPGDVVDELRAAIRASRTESDWERMLDRLDEAGFRPNTEDADRLQTTAGDFLQRKITAEETTDRIRAIIEHGNDAIGALTEKNAYWNVAEVRLRLLDSLKTDEREYRLAAGESETSSLRVPSTWYVLRRSGIDEKLRAYLQNSVGRMKSLLDTAKKRHPDILEKAKLADPETLLLRIDEQLRMMPALAGGHRSLRRRRRPLGELVQTVRRAVGAVGLADGILRSLVAEHYESGDYAVMTRDLKSALETLEKEVLDRKNVFGNS